MGGGMVFGAVIGLVVVALLVVVIMRLSGRDTHWIVRQSL